VGETEILPMELIDITNWSENFVLIFLINMKKGASIAVTFVVGLTNDLSILRLTTSDVDHL